MGVSCGQCHVFINEPYFKLLNPSPSTEDRTLTRNASTNSVNSRLACCVKITPQLNEMIVTVAFNRSSDGDWFGGQCAESF